MADGRFIGLSGSDQNITAYIATSSVLPESQAWSTHLPANCWEVFTEEFFQICLFPYLQ